jgi:hypothetical protein
VRSPCIWWVKWPWLLGGRERGRRAKTRLGLEWIPLGSFLATHIHHIQQARVAASVQSQGSCNPVLQVQMDERRSAHATGRSFP